MEVQGVDLVLLDSLAAGCISSLVDPTGHGDAAKLSLLADLAQQIRAVCSQLQGETRQYFVHLGGVADAALVAGANRK
jgi:hypothetical protein